jgi:glycosyltransferase involved in cell wall biosynthesis
MPSDIILSFKQFLINLEKKHGHRKTTLVMHTDPMDPEGPNLHHVIDMTHLKDYVVFSNDRVGFPEMNALYNFSDVIVNRSCNEGFGLGTLEAMMAGRPIIALKTGGLTRQVEDYRTGEQYGIALEPEVKTLVGNQMVPYIYEDFISHETLAKAFMTVYEWGPEKRAEVGQRAMAHAHQDYNIDHMFNEWDRTLTHLLSTWRQKHERWVQVEL